MNSNQGRFAEQRPQRVRVQAPQDAGLTAPAPAPQLSAESFYVRQLIRSQFRLALSVASGLLIMLVGMSAVLAFWPMLSTVTLLLIPLPWWILGVGVYPLIIVAGLLFNRSAARNERRYRSISK